MRLPDPRDYKTFKPKIKPVVYQQQKEYDFKAIKHKESVSFNYFSIFYPKVGLIDKLFTNDLLPKTEYERLELFKTHFEDNIRLLYSMRHNSIVIELYHNKEIVTLAFRYYYEKITKLAEDNYIRDEKSVIKWKTYGSKRFIPYKLRENNNYCFVAFGMAEILLFEILNIDYFVLQSDSIAYNLPYNSYFKPLKEKLQDRSVYIIPDNDKSSFDAGESLKSHLKGISKNIFIIPLETITSTKLKKGYDLRDLFNEYPKDLAIELIFKAIKKVKGVKE